MSDTTIEMGNEIDQQKTHNIVKEWNIYNGNKWVISASENGSLCLNVLTNNLQALSQAQGVIAIIIMQDGYKLLASDVKKENKTIILSLKSNLSQSNYSDFPLKLVNRIMLDIVALWKEATGKEKWDFAEASGLWKVHPDEDGWQRTATLDKYLDFRKMPKFPRWITVIESARFVLQEVKKRNFVSDKIKKIEQNVEELEGVLKGKVAA